MPDEPTREQRARLQQQRAEEAIASINAGANVTGESYRLANEFTDAHSARFGAWLRRVFRRS